MDTKKFLIIVITIVAVGVAVIVGIRTFTRSGKFETSEGVRAIEQASQQSVTDPSRVPPPSAQPKGVVTRLPGNKGQSMGGPTAPAPGPAMPR